MTDEPLSIDLGRYRIAPGEPPRLAERDTADTQGFVEERDEDRVDAQVRANQEALQDLQERLFAEKRQALLLVLQAMDTAGKDSTIEHVVGPLNPQGVRVWNFGVPSEKEAQHDFLWRIHKRVPGHGYVGVFNRSHYEDVLVVRVKELADPETVERRYGHINAFERLLHDEGTRVVKVMLHISKDYQRERLRRRLRRPDKHWKFNPGDLKDRARWDDYQEAYEIALTRCSTEHAPWYVVPAEERWYRDLVISQLLLETLRDMDPQFPAPTFDPADYPPDSIE
ncbi:MAG: polyphosphate kinase 2 family protein [Rhodothermales bacterium]|nr:polyphosphate kinase 2 family protein [Rhodothermales bacterium]